MEENFEDYNNLRISDNDKETGVRPNKCSQCNYASFYAGHLRRHLKTHSEEKPNKCNQCDYASSSASKLRRHMKTHSGEKQNKCNQCDYTSSRTDSLMTHLKTHSGEKQNKCNQCDYASSEVSDLRKHWQHTVEKSRTSVTNVTMQLPMSALWGHIWKLTAEKS